MSAEIPEEVVKKIRDFMAKGCTGHVTLHFNEGHINSYEIRETGNVARKETLDSRAKVS